MADASPDILVFLSDQHTARLMGIAGDSVVETPHLDALARDGIWFDSAQAACPLCVPSRCAFMTGRLPASTGVLTNGNVMPSDLPTFAHSAGGAGYETVLCGRMHFSGQDQRHGFTRRLVGDFTPCIPGRGGPDRADLGPYVMTPAAEWEKHFGGGDSPVLAYDRAVVEGACEELARDHDRPLLMVVGTYGPHHTFVAPEELYRKYLDRVEPPIGEEVLPQFSDEPSLTKEKGLSEEEVRQLRAAYYGMVELTDRHVGQVRAAWQERLRKRGRKGVFIYASDHGEQAGNRGLWGKMTFFADSVGIPMVIAGDGVSAVGAVSEPVSLIDLTATLCDLAGGRPLPQADGASLRPFWEGGERATRRVVADRWKGGRASRMIVTPEWKYWIDAGAEGREVLIDRRQDQAELHNVAVKHPDLCRDLRMQLMSGWDPEAIAREQQKRREAETLFAEWGTNSGVEEPDRWVIPESSWVLPVR